jgi:hypothetical protein
MSGYYTKAHEIPYFQSVTCYISGSVQQKNGDSDMTRMVLALMLVLTMGLAQLDFAQADVLLIEEVRQSDRMSLPVNGMTKDDVRARFGDPTQIHDAVGDPPITQWAYDTWSVYFEYQVALFTVLHKGAVIDKKSDAE